MCIRDSYDAVLLIIGFLLLGKALEARAKRRAQANLLHLDPLGRAQGLGDRCV